MTKVVRKIIQIDEEKCDGCGLCVPSCAEGAIRIIDGKARLVSETYCDGLGACLGHCPRGAIRVVERQAAPFDEEAVRKHLQAQQEAGPSTDRSPPHAHPVAGQAQAATQRKPTGGCPGTALRVFGSGAPEKAVVSEDGSRQSTGISALGQWPIQFELVPAGAPFLKGCHLLIAADCVPFAFAGFHDQLLAGRRVLVGCPKLDDLGSYVAKLAQIIATAELQSITVARMEVPCCGGLMWLVRTAMEQAGRQVPVEEVVISIDGRKQPTGDPSRGASGH